MGHIWRSWDGFPDESKGHHHSQERGARSTGQNGAVGAGADGLRRRGRGARGQVRGDSDRRHARGGGGEAQRIKLASELSKRSTGNTFYILDEPTTGLHFEDVQVLLDVINVIINKGNTVLIIEHNMEVIKVADYIIDIGPEGGEKGGEIVCNGKPEKIVEFKDSYTARLLLH